MAFRAAAEPATTARLRRELSSARAKIRHQVGELDELREKILRMGSYVMELEKENRALHTQLARTRRQGDVVGKIGPVA